MPLIVALAAVFGLQITALVVWLRNLLDGNFDSQLDLKPQHLNILNIENISDPLLLICLSGVMLVIIL